MFFQVPQEEVSFTDQVLWMYETQNSVFTDILKYLIIWRCHAAHNQLNLSHDAQLFLVRHEKENHCDTSWITLPSQESWIIEWSESVASQNESAVSHPWKFELLFVLKVILIVGAKELAILSAFKFAVNHYRVCCCLQS